jgi:hypothetical protein
MDNQIQSGSSDSPTPDVHDSLVQLPVELWEAPFERWLRLADHLLRDWPGTEPAPGEHRL